MSIEKTIEVGYGFEVKHNEPNDDFSEFIDALMNNFGIDDLGPFRILSNINMWGDGEESKIFLILASSSVHLDCKEMGNIAKSFNLNLEQEGIDEAHEYLEKFRGILEPVHEDIRIHLVCSVH